MGRRTPRETYFLTVIAVLVAFFALFALVSLGITATYVVTMLSGSNASAGWVELAAGVLCNAIGVAAVVGLVKLYRRAERCGVLDAPDSR